MKKSLLAGVIGAALCLFCIAGCASSSQGSTTSQESVPEKAAPDVAGIWEVTSSSSTDLSGLADKGIYIFYHFDDDGTFSMESLIQGAALAREGTWEASDGNILINVPESSSTYSNTSTDNSSVTLESDAIEDGVVVIDGDKLSTDDIGSGLIKAKRISEEEYEAAVASSKALGPQDIALGQTVEGDGYSFTITSLSYEDAIYPSNTSGYYSYYADQDGKSYLVAVVNLQNTWSDYMVPGYATDASYNVGGNKYSASVEVDGGTIYSKVYSIDAQDSNTAIIYASIPDSVIDSPDVTLTWTFPKSASGLHQYFSSSNANTTYRLKL